MLLRAALALSIALTGPAFAVPITTTAGIDAKKEKPACKDLPPMAKPAPCPPMPAMAMGIDPMRNTSENQPPEVGTQSSHG